MDDISLADFVSQSLVSIAEGVKKANLEFQSSSNGAMANPAGVSSADGFAYLSDTNCDRVELIQFDVAVRAVHNESNKTAVGVTVAVFGGGMVGNSEARKHSESRLKFTIPLLLPIAARER